MKSHRTYGDKPYRVAVVHGGPGAAGDVAPVARELGRRRGVLEPLQSAATLAGQVDELAGVLEREGDPPLTLVGHSWGAWLIWFLASEKPALAKKLVLVGSGPFESRYADTIMDARMARLDEAGRVRVKEAMRILEDPDAEGKAEAFRDFGLLLHEADAYDLVPHESELLRCNVDVFQDVWKQADERRRSGALLALANRMACPVTAIHGDVDPHPAEGVRAPLSRTLKEFRFVLLDQCGHTPWLERHAREAFYEVLEEELE
jgi:pimeloyl-ACP methyl ester carboxylesterase